MSSQSTGPRLGAKSRVTRCLIVLAFALLGVSSLYGDIVAVDSTYFSGQTRTSDDGGITASPQWDNGGFESSWEITDNQNGTFTYEYLITGEGGGDLGPPDLSHWILQLTPPEGIWDGIFDSPGTDITEIDVRLYEAFEPPNPDLPGDLFGVKFDFDVEEGTYYATFTTEQVPVWGNFFATGGDDYAYNDGFLTMPVAGVTTDFNDWIARPDGATSVPEPSTLVLLLSGMGVLAGAARFRKKT